MEPVSGVMAVRVDRAWNVGSIEPVRMEWGQLEPVRVEWILLGWIPVRTWERVDWVEY